MGQLDIDINAMVEIVADAMHAVLQAYKEKPVKHPTLDNPDLIQDNLNRYLDIIRHIEKQHRHSPTASTQEDYEDMGELGNFGLHLLIELNEWAELLELEDIQQTISELTLPVALWSARHIGNISLLDPIVNTLSQIANQTEEPQFLVELSSIISEIAIAVSPDIKQDLDKSDTLRPWRILNLNHGIVATRSHDPKIMEEVFEQILLRFPEDAPAFFKEGMKQLEIIDYPQHVRSVMEKYFHLTNNPTLH